MKKSFFALSMLVLAPFASAAAIPQLKAFVTESRTLSASFHQTVTAKGKRDEAQGTLEIARPGKFRWNYNKPYDQQIVGDGKKLWIYDRELAQVTTKPLDAALGSSPAALLAGSNAIERDYTLKEAGTQNGLEWLTAAPRKSENTFESIRMGFSGNTLREMELADSFGNVTRIRFDNLKKNPPIAASHFTFTPPKGVDVLSE